LVKSNNLFRNS